MKKKIGVLLTIFVFIIGLLGIKTFATNICTVECNVSNNSPKRGDQFDIVVSVKDIATPISGLLYTLNYDSSKIELIGQVQGLNNWQLEEIENIYSILFKNYETVSTDQQICKLTFKIKDDADLENTTISFQDIQVSKDDSSVENLDDIDITLDIQPKDINLNVSYSTTEKTNNPVVVQISSDVELQAKEGWNKSQDGKSLTKEYNDNIDENVIVHDLFENQATASIHINNIDKINPTITAQNILYGETLNIRLQDAESGVVAWQLNNSQEQPTEGWTDIEETNDTTLSLNEVNAGTYYIWVKDKAGNISSQNIVVEAKDIRVNTNGITRYLAETVCTYDGTEKQPREIVKDGTKDLVKGTDYTVSYANNINAGIGKVTITGIGNYKESVTLEFIINKMSAVVEWNNETSFTYNGELQGPTLKYEQINGANGEVINLNVTGQQKNVGTAYTETVAITSVTGGMERIENYELIGKTKQFSITPKEIQVNEVDYEDYYDEQEHGIELTVVEPTEGYEIYYKEGTEPLTINDYTSGSTTNPKKNEAGIYTIQWYVHSTNPNYSDVSGYNYIIIEERPKATGDMNENNGIDLGDILALLRHIAQANSQNVHQKHPQWELNKQMILIGDVNKNGTIDLGDVLKLRRFIAAKNSASVATKHPSWLTI